MVGWELEDRRVGELSLPIRLLPRQRIALQQFPLPRGELEVLHANGREHVADTQAQVVESLDLLHEDAHGRAVRNDVMEDEPQNVVVCIEAYDPRPEELDR